MTSVPLITARDLAAVVRTPGGEPLLEPVTVAAPGPGELLVRILASGVCHTDLVAIDGGTGYPLPAVFGHEGAGVVEAVGTGVDRVRVGDRVVLGFDSCGACRACRDGHPSSCARFADLNNAPVRDALSIADSGEALTTGWMSQSSWATRVIARESNAVVIADDVPPSIAAPLGCGVLTGAGTVFNVLRPGADDGLLVIGAGAVGLAAVMAAAVAGCRDILVSDPVPARRALALELGATAAVAPDDLAGLLRTTGQMRYVLDTVGTQPAMDAAMAALGPRGVCATVALRPGANRLSIAQGRLLWGRTLTGVIEGDAVLDRDITRLLALWRAGRFPVERLVAEYDFDDIGRAVADARAGRAVKAVLVRRDATDATDASLREPLAPATEAVAGEASDPLRTLRDRSLSDAALAELWRSLPPVRTDELRGFWRGWAVTTGHRAERLLDRMRWVGKRFRADDDVDPIVCRGADGGLVADTGFSKGGASLWRIERDGVVTAAMVYDALPIVDSFTRLSADAVLGVMGGRDTRDDGREFYFVLERDETPPA
ncbi:alcohol dehydrogenase catalytic domain-containing protein [Agromyces larvae]|uniref:Alcohol dehydrogenase catalytic domain-containing protein n=1 Tax=Agromyces larvae TaxID=2929802 RepID=A0ABY4C2S4_9MICO|nr:alcohol dehydrogenase catalytic domain-containing protein [Agromyces larvae]UOE43075.1 alcohol dehydrogenase catalytic domain-containing protein [Agromyces larvae]